MADKAPWIKEVFNPKIKYRIVSVLENNRNGSCKSWPVKNEKKAQTKARSQSFLGKGRFQVEKIQL